MSSAPPVLGGFGLFFYLLLGISVFFMSSGILMELVNGIPGALRKLCYGLQNHGFDSKLILKKNWEET